MKTRVFVVVATVLIAGVVLIGIQSMPAQPKDGKASRPSQWKYKRAENPSDAAMQSRDGFSWTKEPRRSRLARAAREKNLLGRRS